MSGLCAVATFNGVADVTDAVTAMIAAAPHRGIDGVRTWTGAGAAVAHQHRVVTPEDEHDTQPLHVAGLIVVADLRLDNREALVSVLTRHGYLTEDLAPADAELALASYRLWGPACPAYLLGDFAFVVWDTRARRLFAARDPMGMRPLYYRWEAGDRVLVGSEIKQILAVPDVPCRPYEPAIAATLAGPFMPPSWTAYAGVDQLAPGWCISVDASGLRKQRYWAPDPDRRLELPSYPDYVEAYRTTLAEAVKTRLRSAGPVGILLSGGIDSGNVASMAGALIERGVCQPADGVLAYSYAFEELPNSDERAVSDHIVHRYDLGYRPVPSDDAWPLAGFPEHGPDRDDPYIWVYQALVERALAHCREDGLRVLLGGDRGDELTGDWVYDEFGMLRAGELRAAFVDLREATAAPGMSPLVALRRRVLRPIVAARWPGLLRRVRRRQGGQRPWPPWIPSEFAERVDLGDIITEATTPAPFDGAARRLRHQRIFMAQGARLATLHERTRARFGIASADPYSDRRLVELVLSMPQWVVQRRTHAKRLAYAASEGIMPEPARANARKTIPEDLSHRGFHERAVGTIRELLTGSKAAARGWLDQKAAMAVYDSYVREPGRDPDWDFWWPLSVEMWLRRWWTDE